MCIGAAAAPPAAVAPIPTVAPQQPAQPTGSLIPATQDTRGNAGATPQAAAATAGAPGQFTDAFGLTPRERVANTLASRGTGPAFEARQQQDILRDSFRNAGSFFS